MTLQEILNDLGSGEFSNVGLSTEDVIDADQYPKIIRHINLALTDLYSRFNLKSDEEVIALEPTTSLYSLQSPNVLAVTGVYDDYGNELDMNRMNDSSCAIFTPTPTTIQVGDVDTSNLYVIYKAKHPQLEDSARTSTDLELPVQFKQALLYYVGYRVHYNRLKEGSAEIAADLKNRYELECRQLEAWGLTNADSMDSKSVEQFAEGGWA